MPVIEGVGDEVFNVLLIALIVVLGIVGWWSTSISEQPLIRTVLILEPRHHAAAETSANVIAPSPPQDTGQRDATPINEAPTETPAAPNTSSSASKNENQGSQEQQAEPAGGEDPSSSSRQSSEEDASAGVPPIPAPNETKDSNDPARDPDMGESSSQVSTNANELRRRRLQFFEEKHGGENASEASPQGESSNVRQPECAEASSSSSSSQETLEPKETPIDNEPASSDPCLACDDIRIKLKFLNDNQKMVQGKLQEPLGDFKRRNFAVEMAARKVIRLIFNGQVLQSDDRTLQNYGLFDNCVVHCLVHNQRGTNQNAENATNSNVGDDLNLGGVEMGELREWDMSSVLYISTFVILSAIWYLRINFSQMFSATSTVALFGLSGIFVIFLVGMYIPDQEVLRT